MPLSELDIIGQGMALICIKDQDGIEFVIQVLKGIGFIKITQAQSEQDGLDKMKFNHYDILIIEEGFGGPIDNNIVMKEIREMVPSLRRKMFVALLGDRWQTGDEMKAFSLSVNLVINKSGLGQLKEILAQAITKNKKSYKIFNEVLIELGKV